MENDQNTRTTMTQRQGTLGWSPHIGFHPNMPWCCTIVVHKECKDHSPLTQLLIVQLQRITFFQTKHWICFFMCGSYISNYG
jgi:hypothetical protein